MALADEQPETGANVPQEAAEEPGLLRGIWVTGTWRLFPFLLIYSIGIAITIPITPSLITNGFASATAGELLKCEEFTIDTAPIACRNAHATVVMWSSWTNLVSSSLLSFLFAPWVGRMSDRFGRKPFMLLGIILFIGPVAAIMMHLWGWIPIYWYFPASALNGAVSAFHMCLVSVSDLIEQRHRAAVVGLLMSMLSAGFLVGPIIGAVLHDPLSGIYACIACLGCTFVYTALVVKECAPVRVRAMKAAAAAKAAARGNRAGAAAGTAKPTSDSNSAAAGLDSVCVDESAPMLMAKGSVPFERSSDGEDSCSADGSSSSGTHHGTAHLEVPGASSEKVAALAGDEETSLSGWQIIIHSKFYRRLALLWVIFTVNMDGAQVLLIQYLQLTIGFGTSDTAILLVVLATAGLVVKVGIMPWLVKKIGEQKLVMLGLFAYCLEDLGLALSKTRNQVLGAVTVGSIAGMCWPVLIALQSSRVQPSQQGAVYGTMQAITALAGGLGPLAFASLFSAFTRSDSGLPFMPSIVWYISSAMMFGAIVVASTLYIGVGTTQEDEALATAAVSRASSASRLLAHSAPAAGQLTSMRSFSRAMSRLVRRNSLNISRNSLNIARRDDAEAPLLMPGMPGSEEEEAAFMATEATAAVAAHVVQDSAHTAQP